MRILCAALASIATSGFPAAAIAQSPPALASVDWPEPQTGETQLMTYPQVVYFTTSNAKQRIAASTFYLGIDAPTGVEVAPGELTIDYLIEGKPIRSDRWDTSVLRSQSSDPSTLPRWQPPASCPMPSA